MKAGALAAAVFALGIAGTANAHDPVGVVYPISGAPYGASPPAEGAPAPEPCTEDCFLLSELVLRGSVTGSISFELRGQVRAHEETKVPLFGPPTQVRLEDVTIDGAHATISFDSERYYLLTNRRSFTVRGRLTLGEDQMLAVAGPIVSVDARLSKGRVVEGERLSGVLASVLHFDPMDEASAAKPKAPLTLHVSRALRFGRETTFITRIVASQGTDIGVLHVPLRYGEKVGDVQGAKEWRIEGDAIALTVEGQEAEITISGTMPPPSDRPGPESVRTFSPDERAAYELWLIEADPDHLVAIGGQAKSVEVGRSPIPPTLPGARAWLVERGQHLEVDARSLVRGDVLAAVARAHRRVVAITGAGELISDERIQIDNNGLDHLLVAPAGKAMYLSLGGRPQHILHLEQGASEILVPLQTGSQVARLQSRSDVRIFPMAGVLTVPGSTYPLTTGSSETTIGLPADVRPVAVLGGDRVRTALSGADAVAAALGVVLACFGFRTRRTRVLGALVLSGLWFVSKEGYVVAAGLSFFSGGVFLASRFLRGTKLIVAAGAIAVTALVGGRLALSQSSASAHHEMSADAPLVEQDGTYTPHDKGDVTPVSLSLPEAERYVKTSRQLVSKERPFTPRVVYVTSTFVGILHLVWLALAGALAWAHREALLELRRRVLERLRRTPVAPNAEAPPF